MLNNPLLVFLVTTALCGHATPHGDYKFCTYARKSPTGSLSINLCSMCGGGRGGLDRCCGHLATLMTATSALKVFSGKPSVPATALNYSLAGIVVYHLLSGHLNVPGAELFRALFLRPAMNL